MAGNQVLANITLNASRLGERIQETFSEHTRDLGIGRGVSNLDDDVTLKGKNINKQLESTSEREKLDAMKRLVALISKGRNVSEYFAPVVKNVVSQNLEVRKLVYIYLLKYAEHEPDLALLSINTFQKDLNDSNPLIRANGFEGADIGSLVVMAVRKCSKDMSPYVRKAAALAIPRIYAMDSSHQPALIEVISSMLHSEKSPLSIGCVVVAFDAVCPTRLDLLHKEYRRLCRLLVDVDEWGQFDLLHLLLRYVRTMLARPAFDGSESEMDSDIKLLLKSSEPLLMSANAAVVVSVVRAIFYLGQNSHQPKIVQPLLRLLAASKEVERVVLSYILFIVRRQPSLFSSWYARFLLRSDDAQTVKTTKIQLLLAIFNEVNHQAILREFIDYADDSDDAIVSASVAAIGHCARTVPESAPQYVVVSNAIMVLKRLVQAQLSEPSSSSLPSQPPLKIISQLARKIDDILHADARACVLWLVGQYAGSPLAVRCSIPGLERVAEWAPDVLRKAGKSFTSEPSVVKLQTITLCAKILVLAPTHNQILLLSRYIFELARYDMDYDVRDRARMLFALLSSCTSLDDTTDISERGGVVLRREQVELVLFEGKKISWQDDAKEHLDATHTLGSLSLITGRPAHTDQVAVPDWLEHAVDGTFRDSEEDERAQQASRHVPTALSSAQFQGGGGSGSLKAGPVVLTPRTSSPIPGPSSSRPAYTDLDAFYAEDDHEDSEGVESGSAEEESDEESSEDGEEESSGRRR
ncbi:adaptin N terminal region-domain-containing protein [Flagelloscypha sp. PMI_526]|nr:adaptin N terminal region-domain-containing protein [Flagelloscypha sp. PMI_526]